METKFKTLMFWGQYVDANRLEYGIYTSYKPFIYSIDDTIETLIERAMLMKDMTGANFISENYLSSLKQCELVEIIIKVI